MCLCRVASVEETTIQKSANNELFKDPWHHMYIHFGKQRWRALRLQSRWQGINNIWNINSQWWFISMDVLENLIWISAVFLFIGDCGNQNYHSDAVTQSSCVSCQFSTSSLTISLSDRAPIMSESNALWSGLKCLRFVAQGAKSIISEALGERGGKSKQRV